MLKSVTLDKKYEALMDLKSGMRNTEVSVKYGVPKNTVSTWKKNSDKIIAARESCVIAPKRKRLRTGQHANLESALFQWFQFARSKKIPICGKIIQEKALHYANELDIADFNASDGWLVKWKKRFSVSFKVISGRGAAVTEEVVSVWTTSLLAKYEQKDIYNATECSLYFQALPNTIVAKKNLHRRKENKVRVTVLCCANAVGEKYPLFVIGKSKQPKCFEGVKHLPCRYRHQVKAWMNEQLFSDWVQEFDRTMTAQHRNVVLILDNSRAHPQEIPGLKSVKLSYLPPSVTQPLDQGVIRTMKAYYRTHLVRRIIKQIDVGSSSTCPKGVSVLDAMMMVTTAWQQVKDSTVKACFRKAGISTDARHESEPFGQLQIDASSEAEVHSSPTTQLQEELSLLRSKHSSLVPEDLTAENWVTCDDHVATSSRITIDEEIIRTVLKKDNVLSDSDDSEDDTVDEPSLPVPVTEVREALGLLQRYALFADDENIGLQATKLTSLVEHSLSSTKT